MPRINMFNAFFLGGRFQLDPQTSWLLSNILKPSIITYHVNVDEKWMSKKGQTKIWLYDILISFSLSMILMAGSGDEKFANNPPEITFFDLNVSDPEYWQEKPRRQILHGSKLFGFTEALPSYFSYINPHFECRVCFRIFWEKPGDKAFFLVKTVVVLVIKEPPRSSWTWVRSMVGLDSGLVDKGRRPTSNETMMAGLLKVMKITSVVCSRFHKLSQDLDPFGSKCFCSL